MAGKDITKFSEKWLEPKLGKELKNICDCEYIKLLPFQIAGLPDRLVLLPSGVALFVEIKSTGQKPRKIQEWWHARLTKLGFAVFVVGDLTSLNLVLDYAKFCTS